MGWHIILKCTAIIKPEYIELIKFDYFSTYAELDLPEHCKVLYDIWHSLSIVDEHGGYFYKFDLKGNEFSFEICKKPYFNRVIISGKSRYITLRDDYERMMAYVIAPMANTIVSCVIEEDDYGDRYDSYTEEEVRGWKPWMY